MITIDRLRYRTLAIDALGIRPGITTIIGANGSGKTTFLRLCTGIAVPDSGSIMIDGSLPRETEIGWVNEFPDRNILFVKVYDEIASPLRFGHTPCQVTDQLVRTCAESLGIAHLLDRPVRELSGGEKVLVALAAALVRRPKVLVLDECDSHLDANRSEQIDSLVRNAGANYVIRCTQQSDIAAQGDNVLFFDNGRLAGSGTPASVFASLAGTLWYPPSWMCSP